MDKKGQGALEYLLLIGGAIVVAVVVVTLLLNLGSTGGGTSSGAAAGSICSQKAVAFANTYGRAGDCDENGLGTAAAPFAQDARRVWVDKCYVCTGAYPACNATVSTGTWTAGTCTSN